MSELTLLREYEPWELGDDGYPRVWHQGIAWVLLTAPSPGRETIAYLNPESDQGVKHLVRERAGHRCERCGHPYTPGCGTMEEHDPLHARRTERDLGVPQPVLDAALMLLVADGEVHPDPDTARRMLWSPCDERCTHAGPIRMKAPDRARPGALHLPWIVHDETSKAPAGGHVARGRYVEAAWRILTVHHLNGRKHDLRWWNLTALCQRCHLYMQRTVIMERVWPWEHDEWFKPHAAGWYAYAYRGENLTREETMQRLDELLALERVA